MHSLLQNVNIQWEDITNATELSDGVVLNSSNASIHWLPYRCLDNQTDAGRLFEFISSRISNRIADASQPQSLQEV